MPGCRRYQAMMAASLYETLDEDDRASLQRHLEACPRCSQERAAFQHLLVLMPSDNEELPRDLVGSIRARIAQEAKSKPTFSWLPAWGAPAFAGACALMLGFSVFFLGPDAGLLSNDGLPSGERAPALAAAAGMSPVASAIAEAESLISVNQHDEAARVLRAAVQQEPDSAAAGEAQRKLAALTFEHFRLYEVAFQEYMKLRNQFGEVYQQDPESITRFELLTEEWENQFQALAAIDAARDRAYDDPFRQLESVMASNPGKHVATIALNEMQRLVRAEQAGADSDLRVLEAVRERCEDPIAVAQVNLHLGDIYCDALENTARARELYQEVIDGGSPVLAERAGQALARLELGP